MNSASFRRDKSSRSSTSMRARAFLALQLRDACFNKLTIQIEPDRHDVAALGRAENAARAANLEIGASRCETPRLTNCMLDRVDPFPRRAHRHHLAAQHEIGVGLVLGRGRRGRGADKDRRAQSDPRDR